LQASLIFNNNRNDYYYFSKKFPSGINAIFADSVKLYLMIFCLEIGSLIHPVFERFIDRKFQVNYRTAVFTDKVVVVGCIRVKTVERTSEVYLPYHTLFRKNREISIDRPQTESRILFLEFVIYPIGVRM